MELEFKKKFTLEIPTTLEEDEEGVSYSDEDRCPATCEVSVDSKAPKSLWVFEDGKLIINPTEPSHIGAFRF